jgi:hypothetical protein
MKYSAIVIQGNILSGEILEKIRLEDINYQKPASFGLDQHVSIRDEIGMSWTTAKSYWQGFCIRRQRLNDNETGTTETRNAWVIPFLNTLGYDLEKSKAEIINDKSYAISHRASNRDQFPVHMIGINQSLDKQHTGVTSRISAHALVQEYLNHHDHLYALVTNGRSIRLLRDATRLNRLSYLEFDIERMMEEDLFVEFAILFRTLHCTRMPEKHNAGDDAIIEYFHQESLASGSRIRERLSIAVEDALKLLANGLLKHPENNALREKVLDQHLDSKTFFLYLLRLIYRILFLLVTEARHLIYPEDRDDDTERKRLIYFKYYSISRLINLAEMQIYIDHRKTDLWRSLFTTFYLFEKSVFGQKLNISPLGAGLFRPDALGNLNAFVLDNQLLLKVLSRLVMFENENKQLVYVNYADLDVEEFGSVYEGLLEYDATFKNHSGMPVFQFVKGSERTSSGSHYTPEELVKPLIDHSLKHLIQEKIKQDDPEKALLSIKIADVSAGSGHILLSAARSIALALARIRTGEDQPSPPSIRQATRDVICNCIYGVDKNPLAVELCKVALWLEAHNPGKPLNFLDHRIKCGDAIVGLVHKEAFNNSIASQAFNPTPDDDKKIASTFARRNKRECSDKNQLSISDLKPFEQSFQEINEKLVQLEQMPENSPEEIEQKQKAYHNLIDGNLWWHIKTLADIQVAQFFIPKNQDNKKELVTYKDFNDYLKGTKSFQGKVSATAIALAEKRRFFHYFLEFPDVFANGGFDCVIGNPPFLGGQRISTHYGHYFLNYIHHTYKPAKGTCDLVGYFFRRIFSIIQPKGFFSLIATNTISQGMTREGSLKFLLDKGNSINHAVSSIKWPGLANVEVSLVTMFKGIWTKDYVLDRSKVEKITSYLDTSDSELIGEPYTLHENQSKSFIGSYVLGKGFVLTPEEAQTLINKNPKNKDVLFPYLNGKDLNTRPDQSPSRWVINFRDWDLDYCRDNYPDCFDIVQRLVKPERDKLKNGNPTAKDRSKRWWQFARQTLKLYSTIHHLKQCLVIAQVSRTVAFTFTTHDKVLDIQIIVFALEKFYHFSILQSSLHYYWAWKYCTTMKSDLRYTPSAIFQTFPFPQNVSTEIEKHLEAIGKKYHDFRQQLMMKIQLGLTKTYNQFHNPKLTEIDPCDPDISKKVFIKQYGKESWELWNHLQKTETSCTFNEAVIDIIKLRQLQQEMDQAVLAAYGWQGEMDGDSDGIRLRHAFYSVNFLPENDRVRFTIHPDARKEILNRLLYLNHEIYEKEKLKGVTTKKKKSVKKKSTKNCKNEIAGTPSQLPLF